MRTHIVAVGRMLPAQTATGAIVQPAASAETSRRLILLGRRTSF
jgi:hypothetical protein